MWISKSKQKQLELAEKVMEMEAIALLMYKTNNRSSGKEQTMSKTKRRCPNCGSPVIIKGNRFECGWCGNFGKVSCLI